MQDATTTTPATGRGRGRTLLLAGAHLAALASFGIAEPLFSLLSKNAEFFAARASRPIDIVTFALAVTLVPPLVLLLVEALVGLASERARQALHLVFVAALTGLFALQALKKAGGASTGELLVVSGIAGVAAAALYARRPPVRSFLTVLSPAPALFLLLFLVVSPVSKLVLPQGATAHAASVSSRAPIVLLILDEFPLTDLLGPDGRIDAQRYPNFARLAASSTWYRHATSVFDSTTHAVPVILTGQLPRRGELPTAADHPNNIFTLFGHNRMNVSEEATHLCVAKRCHAARGGAYGRRMRSLGSDLGLVYLHLVLPPAAERRLPSISQTWGDFTAKPETVEEQEPTAAAVKASAEETQSIAYHLNRGRPERLEQWIAAIQPSRTPSLNVKHVLLPHVPFQYLPSGRSYRRTANEAIPGIGSKPSWGDALLVEQARQRHLLQVGFVDHELGKLIDHLQRTGLWSRALVVVTPDHGMAFHVNEDRRVATRSNLQDIAAIPVFIKSPGQRAGRVSGAWLRTVDILPTMAAILHVPIAWRHDGRPATSAAVRRRRTVMMIKRDFSGRIEMGAGELERRVRAALRTKLRLFGSGASPPGLYGLGPNPQLVGASMHGFQVATAASGAPRASLGGKDELASVRLASGFVPAQIYGTIEGDAAHARHDLAIAVNGRIGAVTRSFYLAGSSQQQFAAMAPETLFHDGANDVRVLLVERTGAGVRLTEIGGT